MLVTKSNGEPRITVHMTPDEARLVKADLERHVRLGFILTGESSMMLKGLTDAITPVETCEVNIGGNINNKCKHEAKHRWKVTCKNDHLRTRNYCDYHGSTREAAELLVCRPCKIDGLGHVYVVGVAKVKL